MSSSSGLPPMPSPTDVPPTPSSASAPLMPSSTSMPAMSLVDDPPPLPPRIRRPRTCDAVLPVLWMNGDRTAQLSRFSLESSEQTSSFDNRPPLLPRDPVVQRPWRRPPAPCVVNPVLRRQKDCTVVAATNNIARVHRESDFMMLNPPRGVITASSRHMRSLPAPCSHRVVQPDNPVTSLSNWPIRSASDGFSLDSAARHNRRHDNEYVDSPSLDKQPKDSAPPPLSSRNGAAPLLVPTRNVDVSGRTPDGPVNVFVSMKLGGDSRPVTRVAIEPKSSSKCATTVAETSCRSGLTCNRCGQCRCTVCGEAWELPRRWVGDHEISAQSAVDICSCIYCVRGILYHCCPSMEDGNASDEPCACSSRPNCALRWTVLGLLLPCLPCLCLYWPLRGALGACTACYNVRRRARSCRCADGSAAAFRAGGMLPEKLPCNDKLPLADMAPRAAKVLSAERVLQLSRNSATVTR